MVETSDASSEIQLALAQLYLTRGSYHLLKLNSIKFVSQLRHTNVRRSPKLYHYSKDFVLSVIAAVIRRRLTLRILQSLFHSYL